MEIIQVFGSRKYIFYSHTDITKATSLYVECTGTLNDFERMLDEAGIDYCYDI